MTHIMKIIEQIKQTNGFNGVQWLGHSRIEPLILNTWDRVSHSQIQRFQLHQWQTSRIPWNAMHQRRI